MRFRDLIFALMAGLLATTQAAAKDLGPYSSWIVYWDYPKSCQAAVDHFPLWRELGLFCGRLDSDGHVVFASPKVPAGLRAFRNLQSHPRMILAVTNDRELGTKVVLKDPAIVDELLSSDANRAAHIKELVSLAQGADGLEMDYENLHAKLYEPYAQFIQELAGALHQSGKTLSVVVQARLYDKVKDEAGAMNWKAIAQSADEVKLMAYHYHHATGEPGAIAPPDWVTNLAHFALQSIPPQKLTIVLTMSGFDWPQGAPGVSIEFPKAIELARAQHAVIERDPASQSPTFTYTKDGRKHEVWFEDAESLHVKLNALSSAGVRAAFWRLGTGDPAFWSDLSKNERSNSPPPNLDDSWVCGPK